ncbi:MAG TPA: hypothetical protein VGQ55_00570 [Pyrinomonadaceae bacterium]|jgi:hypothetical protein|nr:hypothetical protein [Pyrinomonadaceae bacterium]
MNVLLITEKLDMRDEISGLFHSRLLDFANDCTNLTVLVLENKAHALPPSVKVISLGKEKGASQFTYLWNFYKAIFGNATKYDRVFVHRSPIYIVLGGFFWRLMGKEVTLWYNHTFVDWKLRVSIFFVNHVLSTPGGFPLPTPKLRIIDGMHDLDTYVCDVRART